MYSAHSIDDVRNADILRVVGNYLDLKKTGSKYFAKSPFSNDKTASFCVTPSLNIFKCFSSGKGGDAIKFVMEYKRVPFYDAIETIAGICNITLIKEEVTPEVKAKLEYKEQLIQTLSQANDLYSKSYQELPADHWAKVMVAERQFKEDALINFSIGYAPDKATFLTTPALNNGKLEVAERAGLISSNENTKKDFFRNRLMFPIHDAKGRVVGFGGRAEGDIKPKYLNSKDSDVYSKSKILYGFFQAKMEIAKYNKAILVEGYTDVIAMHQAGAPIAVANCGTVALSEEQLKQIKRLAGEIIICRDNDGLELTETGEFQKGIQAMMKDVDVLLRAGFSKVSVLLLPVGEDPDSFSRKNENAGEYFLDSANYKNAILWKTEMIKNWGANDPDKQGEVVNRVAEMLLCIKDDIVRKNYMSEVAKNLKPLKLQDIKARMELLLQKAEVKSTESNADAVSFETQGLPAGADFKQYISRGFVEHENTFYFRGREKFFKGTNFRVAPLFHIYGKQENKRLFEIISEIGKKKIIDIDSADLVNKTKFEAKIMSEGNFKLMPETTDNHFKAMRNYLMDHFVMAYELQTLGQQKERFFAFANRIYHNHELLKPNAYGIFQLETEANEEIANDENQEYLENIKHYYSPSEAVMNKNVREGDDPYENDRYFQYKESPVSLFGWFTQLKKVYGNKSHVGIAYVVATLFRDVFLKRYQLFPHLFCTGEKGSGKSKFAESLQSLFTYKQEAFDLNSGTPVAFYRRLSRVTNITSMFEEYHDGVDDRIFQALKGAYDGRGRETGKATSDNRTVTTKVNCALIILSQYLSARDDNSLTSRSIVLHFIKPQDSYTTEAIEEYAKLKSWEETGLSSMLLEILKHRDYVETKLHQTYAELNKQMKSELKGKEYQERMLQNYLVLLTPVKILEKLITFPFKFEDLFNEFRDAIIDSSDLIIESEGLAEFWRVLEFLLDSKRIHEGREFKIDRPHDLKLQGRKGEAAIDWTNTGRKQLLFIRLSAVHQLYHKEVSMRSGVDVIGENTLKNYFKSKKYFVGAVKSVRFSDTATSAYVFDYDQMLNGGILNMERTKNGEVPSTPSSEDDDNDLPY